MNPEIHIAISLELLGSDRILNPESTERFHPGDLSMDCGKGKYVVKTGKEIANMKNIRFPNLD